MQVCSSIYNILGSYWVYNVMELYTCIFNEKTNHTVVSMDWYERKTREGPLEGVARFSTHNALKTCIS
jgi:hypothetical protein